MESSINILNETFETALADDNNRRIIAKVCRRYKNHLPKEELTYRGHIALFNCLRKHDPSHTTQFTTSLHRHIVWECRKALRDFTRHPPFTSLPEEHEPSKFKFDPLNRICVHECVDMLPSHHADILRNYYFKNMTLKEIGTANGYTSPAALQKLRQAEDAFRRVWGIIS